MHSWKIIQIFNNIVLLIVDSIDEMTQLLGETEKPSDDKIIQDLRHTQISLNVLPDFKFYILICAAFNPKIISSYEFNFNMIKGVLTQLLKQEEKGFIHLF